MPLCIITQKHVFLIPHNQENTKKLNNSKNLYRVRVEIHYLYHHMPILVAMACLGPPRNLSLHRGSHRWKLSVITTMERNQVDRGWTPYLHPVCASHLPNDIGMDLKPRVVERQL